QDRRGQAQEEPPHRPAKARRSSEAHSGDDVVDVGEVRVRGVRADGSENRGQRTSHAGQRRDRRGVQRRPPNERLQGAREGRRVQQRRRPASRDQAKDGHAARGHARAEEAAWHRRQQSAGRGNGARGNRRRSRRRTRGRGGQEAGVNAAPAGGGPGGTSATGASGGGSARFRFAPVLAATVITLLALLLLYSTAELFLLLFIAVLISLYLGALSDGIQSRTGWPRRGAVALAIIASLAVFVGFIWLLVPPIVEQTQALVKVLPDTILRWDSAIDQALARNPALRSLWNPGQHRVLLAVYEQTSRYFTDVLPKLFGALGFTIEIVSVAIMGVYLTLHPGLYREYLIALFPPLHRDLVRNVLADLSRTLRSWIVGQLASMTLLGVLTTIGLWALGVPYWLTFGLFAGVAAIVPFFGTLTSTLLPALFVLGASGGPGRALAV